MKRTATERRVGAAIALGLALALPAARADDVGDSAEEAAVLTPGAGAITRVIEWDADHDWFVFGARPWVDYTVTVSTGTIWDCEVSLVAPAGFGVLKYTNTIAGTAAQATFLSTTTAARVYVDVRALVEFTTGTYHIAVGESIVDTNGNGLPDAWETKWFGGLTTNGPLGDVDLDGFSNGSEYLAGTDPQNATSLLKLTQIARATNAAIITWQTVPGGWYRLSSASYPGTPAWTTVAPLAAAVAVTTSHTNTAPATTSVYRAELVY